MVGEVLERGAVPPLKILMSHEQAFIVGKKRFSGRDKLIRRCREGSLLVIAEILMS